MMRCGPAAHLAAFDAPLHRVEHAVDERHGLFGAEAARQLQRLVDDDGGGVAGSCSSS